MVEVEKRKFFTDQIHGHVGKLTYLPAKDATTQVGALHTSRITSEAPYFKVIGSSAELYPPSKSPSPEISSNLWQERRIQKRWLLQAHPEAFMGNSAISGLLEENMVRYSKVEGELSDRPLLSIGQMTNIADHWMVSGTPMLAAATGESGELLRLARIDESKWQWEADKHTTLTSSVIDPDDPEEEAIWISDGLPISQVKFATSLSRYEAVRWLIVQKQTSTTILNPEYHKVPVAQSSIANFNTTEQPRLSRINPNPILVIPHKMTGGNAQMDVAFNPNAKGQSPQIAIIDECGYWSIWDTFGGRARTRLSSSKLGHISDGLLNKIPPTSEHKAAKHGILFVGTAKVDSFWEDESQNDENPEGLAKRASHLLIWNRGKCQVLDLESHMALPQLPLFVLPKKPDAILDIRVSPVNQNHIFVLTMRTLHWIDLFPKGEDDDESSKPVVLISSPRLLDSEALRMTTCLTSEGGQQAVMVFVFSSTRKQIQTYWFGFSKQTGLPYWHRDVLSIPDENNTFKGAFQSLEFHPVSLAQDGQPSPGLGGDYYRAGVQFYQGSILSKDLGVQYCICGSVKDRGIQLKLPTELAVRSKTTQAQRWKKRRRNFLRYMDNAFVLPDGVANNIHGVVKRPDRSTKPANRSAAFGPIRLKLDLLCRSLQESLVAVSQSIHDIPPALLFAIQENITEGTNEGRLPLKTWKDIGDEMGSMELVTNEDAEQPDILDLFLGDDGQTVVTQLGRQTSEEWIRELVSLSHLNQTYVDLWLDPLEGRLPDGEEELRRGWIADLAKDMFLATAGIMVQDTPLLGPARQGGDERNQPAQSSAMRVQSSQSSHGGIPSSPPSTTSNTTSDDAIRRLQLLAPSLRLDKMESVKQSSVLAHWPTERGMSTDDYISSVAIASDKKFDDARSRLRRIESKRKAHAEKYKLPSAMRQSGVSTPKSKQSQSQIRTGGLGGPPRSSQMLPQREDPTELPPMPAAPTPAQFMSSQQGAPSSSQSQGIFGPSIAMSQPVPGIFGDRKKNKKPKRKSGFR